MKMYISGKWVEKAETLPVLTPFDQSVIDTVTKANASDVDLAIGSAVRGADELLEVVPGALRVRKKELQHGVRQRASQNAKKG